MIDLKEESDLGRSRQESAGRLTGPLSEDLLQLLMSAE
jgi:hypothetical protein